MTEINSGLPSEIDDFFDNIPDNEEDLTSLFIEVVIILGGQIRQYCTIIHIPKIKNNHT
jgi:hypothetical protein